MSMFSGEDLDRCDTRYAQYTAPIEALRVADKRIAELEAEVERLKEENTALFLRVQNYRLGSKPTGEEWDALQAEVERLRGLVRELADDLEAEVMARYCEDGKLVHPAYERRLNRDMEPVIRARRALEGKGDE